MNVHRWSILMLAVAVSACGPGGVDDASSARGADAAPGAASSQEKASLSSVATVPSQLAAVYVADFVATAATGWAMNDAGDVAGRSAVDTGCGPFCLPPQDNVVWRDGRRIVLPLLPGIPAQSHYPRFLNATGSVAGVTGVPGSSTRAAIWTPDGAGGYTVQDLGVLPGMSSAEVGGLDDLGRIVGWSTLGGAIPSAAAPFLWSAATGMVNLAAQGYPNERPAAMSRGGSVVTWGTWYRLGDPASAVTLPAPPRGFMGPGTNGSAINDAGDQAHFLVSTSTQSLVYPFRLAAGGTWQQLSSAGTGHLSRAAMGSIGAARDVTYTAQGTGSIAPGPDLPGQPLAPLLSPAYGGAAVTDAGTMNASGRILAQVMVGRSSRLMKLVPATPCDSDCLVSGTVAMTARFIEDPARPGQCFDDGKAYNVASAAVTIVDEAGAPAAGVEVAGRFLDDYWTDRPVSGVTDASGTVRWTHTGSCGVGAIAFLVERAASAGRRFDRTRGQVVAWAIPGTAPPPANAAPVPVPLVTCTGGRVCAFDGTGSYDPDGTVASWRWTTKNGTVLSTAAAFTHTYPKAGRQSIVLHVTDNGGLSASKSTNFKVLP